MTDSQAALEALKDKSTIQINFVLLTVTLGTGRT